MYMQIHGNLTGFISLINKHFCTILPEIDIGLIQSRRNHFCKVSSVMVKTLLGTLKTAVSFDIGVLGFAKKKKNL